MPPVVPPLPLDQTQAQHAVDLQIGTELASLGVRDQTIRETEPAGSPKIDQIDHENGDRLKELLVIIGGWPTISRFGRETTAAAWLVAQHADYNPPFQADCVRQMAALPVSEVDQINVAYLQDRALLNSGQPQRYGTIWNAIQNPLTNGFDLVPSRLEDPASVDSLRQRMGLAPLAVQQQQMAAELAVRLTQPNPPTAVPETVAEQ